MCDICGDTFEQFWDEEEEAWHLKDAVRVSGEVSDARGRHVHLEDAAADCVSRCAVSFCFV